MLFGRGQNPFKSHQQEIVNEMGVDVFGPPAHVFLFEARHALADGGFDLSKSLHQVAMISELINLGKPRTSRMECPMMSGKSVLGVWVISSRQRNGFESS